MSSSKIFGTFCYLTNLSINSRCMLVLYIRCIGHIICTVPLNLLIVLISGIMERWEDDTHITDHIISPDVLPDITLQDLASCFLLHLVAKLGGCALPIHESLVVFPQRKLKVGSSLCPHTCFPFDQHQFRP